MKNAKEGDKEVFHLQMELGVHQHAMPTVICLLVKESLIPKCRVDAKEIKYSET